MVMDEQNSKKFDLRKKLYESIIEMIDKQDDNLEAEIQLLVSKKLFSKTNVFYHDSHQIAQDKAFLAMTKLARTK